MKELNVALVAHDARKKELIDWVEFNIHILHSHNLIATGTTARLLSDLSIEFINLEGYKYVEKLNVTALLSGPLGGDAQIASLIAENKIDVLIFFCDNLLIQAHNSDIQGLTRLASLYNIAFATNRTTADMILTSSLFGSEEYIPVKQDFNRYLNRKI